MLTPHSLLERLRQPNADRQAWNRFVALYTELLYRWVRRSGVQAFDASDVVQDVLLVLLRELPAYQPTPNVRFRTWLWTVMRNRVRSFRRRRFPEAVGDELDDLAAPNDQDVSEELALLLRKAAELLQSDFQPNTWRAFWETGVNGRNAKEVADELDMSIGAVYAARFRVQLRIREELAGFLD